MHTACTVSLYQLLLDPCRRSYRMRRSFSNAMYMVNAFRTQADGEYRTSTATLAASRGRGASARPPSRSP